MAKPKRKTTSETLKGVAPNSVAKEVKKGRKKLSGSAKAAIVVAIIAIVVVLIVVGVNAGWYDFILKKQNSIQMPDLTEIQVQEDLQDVDDDTLEYQIESILSEESTEEEVTGKIKDGDTVNIDYEGILEGETEPFDGGSAEDYDLSIGSDTFITGFEDGLIGHKAGDTVELNLTFPDDYSSEDLQGKNVTFTVTINSATRTKTPELTDDWVKEYSKEHYDTELSTVDEFKEYVKQDIIDSNINDAIMDYIEPRATVKSYGEVQEAELMEYVETELEYMASSYGYDEDSLAALYGYDSADEYCEETAHTYQKEMMIIDEICKQKNITVTDEDVDAEIQKYINEYGYGDSYTVETLKETQGDTWLLIFTELEVKYQLAMESLHDNVVYVEEVETVETTTEETSEEESVDESADDSEEDVDEASVDSEEDVDEASDDSGEDVDVEVDDSDVEVEVETESE